MSRLADRYELRHVVGRGGMGRVWAARDVHSGRDVAVKTAEAVRGGTGALRREAALAASVDHPGVVEVHDAGHDGDMDYLVMDLLSGPDLAAVLEDGPVPPAEALRIVHDLADALAAVHDAGVVHGDVKPANVVLTDDAVVLVDFGVAAASPSCAGPVTFGTAPYMAPEQVASAPATGASDVYALGCLLTATLAGRPPFTADSPTEILHRHVRAAAPRLRELVLDVPPSLDELGAAMLHKEPNGRCSAAEVRDVLADMRGEVKLPHRPLRPVGNMVSRPEPDATRPILELSPAV
ncbi:serine/threonine protein kinase [Georgenia satyanarayanai]|uniref:serine/threonine-protein kinase n=1 Tax=Georgenia satyanarayanai TaxID=860221 RepID=UPI00203DD7A2|nr:serine/threonine-protein kinase [Georgenia satyanarayanai]MCM3661783.1 serine/threonine protein kinase [Georgenia satyanarayanai]